MKHITAKFSGCAALLLAAWIPGAATAAINLNSPTWLGNLSLDGNTMSSVKDAVEKAFDAPIDAEVECGEVRGDCVVRVTREWIVDGQKFREIVINIHTVGHASNAVSQENGKWPAVNTK